MDGSQSLHKINTAKKFALDQTIGAVVNTVAFVAFFAALSGKDSIAIQRAVRRVFMPLPSLLRCDTYTAAGHASTDNDRLEALASGVSPQLHGGANASTDTGRLGGGIVLGHLSFALCCGIISVRDMFHRQTLFRDVETRTRFRHVERPGGKIADRLRATHASIRIVMDS